MIKTSEENYLQYLSLSEEDKKIYIDNELSIFGKILTNAIYTPPSSTFNLINFIQSLDLDEVECFMTFGCGIPTNTHKFWIVSSLYEEFDLWKDYKDLQYPGYFVGITNMQFYIDIEDFPDEIEIDNSLLQKMKSIINYV